MILFSNVVILGACVVDAVGKIQPQSTKFDPGATEIWIFVWL
mgnify:CR=1 FL=1